MLEEKIKEIENVLKEKNAYIVASVGGNGNHVGRIKGLAVDANGNLIIEADIDSESCIR